MPARPVEPGFHRQPAADRTLQALSSPIDQVVADMRATVALAPLRCSRLRVNDGFACHRHFAVRAATRHVLDDMPVTVAGGEILTGVHRRRVFPQDLFDDTERLDVILPVHGADEAQTADTVCDGYLVGRGRPSCRLR